MSKKFFKAGAIALMMMSGASLNAQVGINNQDPKATLDVTANAPGVSPEGIISPRVTLNDLNTAAAATPAVYGTAQTGAVVYVNDTTGAYKKAQAQTAKITAVGYYYFDGQKWLAMRTKLLATNGLSLTFDDDSVQLGGTLNKNTQINLNGKNLMFRRLAGGKGNIGIGNVTNPRVLLDVNGNDGEDPLILKTVKLASELNTIDGANPTYYNLQISEQGVVRKTPADGGTDYVAFKGKVYTTALLNFTVPDDAYAVMTMASGAVNITMPVLTEADKGRTIYVMNNNTGGTSNIFDPSIIGTGPNQNMGRGSVFIWFGDKWVSFSK